MNVSDVAQGAAKWDRQYNRPAALSAMTLAGIPSTLTTLGTPLLISAFIGTGRITEAEASTLCSTELAAMALMAFVMAMFVARLDRRMLASGGLAAILVGHALTIATSEFTLLIIARATVGLGVGTLFATSVAGLAGTAKPDRAFGISIIVSQIAVIFFTSFLARVVEQPDLTETVLTLAAFSAVLALGIPFMPPRSPQNLHRDSASPVPKGLGRPIMATLGILLFSMAMGIIWPQIGQIGLARGVPPSAVGGTIAWASVAALVGGLVAVVLGVRLGRLRILTFNTVCLAMIFLLLQTDFTQEVYRAAVLALLFLWPATLPYLFGTLAALDPAGKFAAISGSMMPSGMSIGGLITAAMIAKGASSMLGYLAAAAMMLALLSLIASLQRLSRMLSVN